MRLQKSIGMFLLLASSSLFPQQTPPPVTTPQVIMPLINSPAPAPAPSFSISGNPGNQTIFYWVVANYTVGASSPAGPFIVTRAPGILSGSNFINIFPTYPIGAISVDVLKTLSSIPPTGACACAVATAQTGSSIADTSNSTGAYTVNPVNIGNLVLTLQNEPQSAGVSHLILRQNGIQVADLSTPGGGGTIGGSIAASQIAFGSGVNAIQGNANLTFAPTVTGLVATTSSTGTSTNQGAAFTGIFTGSGTVTQQVGLFGVGQNNSTGTVSVLIGVDGGITNTAGTATEADDFLAASNVQSGPIGLFVGLRVQDHTTTGATQSFGTLFTNGLNAIGFNGAASGQVLSVTNNNTTLGRAPTGGSFNLLLGTGTTQGVTTTTGTNNVCVNASNLECFFSLTSGTFNITIGQSSLFSLTSGNFNIAIGNALGSITTGSDNVAIGANAQGAGTSVSNVTAVGWHALAGNTTTEASAFGNQSQTANTTGLNSSFGSLSLLSNTTGTNNDVFGEDTLRDNVAGNRNVAMGARTLQSNNGGNDNTGIGFVAGYTATPANANVTGSFNTWIGSGSGPGSATQFNNQTVVGAGGLGLCNNCVVSSTDNTFGTSIINAAAPCETAFAPTTLSVAGTTTNSGLNCLPATAVIDAVVYRITTTITTAANFTIGDSTTAARFCAAQSTLTAGTTGICMVPWTSATAGTMGQVAAASVRVTTNVNPGAGAIRLIVYYHTWTPATS